MEPPCTDTTPPGSPVAKKAKITQAQKQALIDNFQLESKEFELPPSQYNELTSTVMERARHLRAHYALQCADLRARAERRVNRIPLSIRKATMGDLLATHQHAAHGKASGGQAVTHSAPSAAHPSTTPLQNRPVPSLPQPSKLPSPVRPAVPQFGSVRGKKRKSNEITIAADKENENVEAGPEPVLALKNPKRAKGPGGRTASRSQQPPSVLSPRSHNSRTLPRSPIKDALHAAPSSPSKPAAVTRPISPLKPASPFKTAASAATSAISASIYGMMEQAKRGRAATANKLARTASQEKEKPESKARPARGKEEVAPSGSAPGAGFGPPERSCPPPRTTSQASTHSDASASSNASVSTTMTVVKNQKGSVTRAGGSKTKASKAAAATAKKAAETVKTALRKGHAVAQNKKVVVAEPATGRRVLRKRT